jgi:hypothetical protein
VSGVAESFQTLDISKMVNATFFNLRDLPPTVTADLASQFDRTAQKAVALAEVDELAEVLKRPSAPGLNSMISGFRLKRVTAIRNFGPGATQGAQERRFAASRF